MSSSSSPLHRLRIAANRPVDGSSLAIFRLVFGLTLVWEVLRYLDHGWVAKYYIVPSFHFKYWPFDFVQPWPGQGMYWHFALLGCAALAMALGLRYRLSAILTFLGIAWIFLLDQTRYLNHIYLVVLLAFLMIFVPADRVGSLDPRRRAGDGTIPAWSLWLMRFQLAVPYFFGGVAKLNHDWLRGEPLTTWLAKKTDFPLLGPLFDEPAVALGMAYGGLLLDLGAPLLLLWPRTRLPAFIGVAGFHLMNSGLFKIGIFPWLMMAGTLLFFPADWPRRMWRDLREENRRAWLGSLFGAGIGLTLGNVVPSTPSGVHSAVAAFIGAFLGHQLAAAGQAQIPVRAPRDEPTTRPLAAATSLMLALWVSAQVLVPLRHLAYRGNVHWTEEGHLYSWHMKLRSKRGSIEFVVTNTQTAQTWTLDPAQMLTKKQTSRMAGRPDMIVQFAHHLARSLEEEHGAPFEVRARGKCRLNDRAPAPLIDDSVDLAQVSRPWLPPAGWISSYPPEPRSRAKARR